MIHSKSRLVDVSSALGYVFWTQSLLCIVSGILLILTPLYRYEERCSYIVTLLFDSDDLLGVVFLVFGLVIAYALCRQKKRLLGHTFFLCSVLWCSLGIFSITDFSVTGNFNTLVFFYVGVQTLIQSVVLLRDSRRA